MSPWLSYSPYSRLPFDTPFCLFISVYFLRCPLHPFLSVYTVEERENWSVFSDFVGGRPKAKLLWAAGGATLSPLVSTESQVEGDDGILELKSMCIIQRSTGRGGQTDRHINTQRNGHTHCEGYFTYGCLSRLLYCVLY